MRRSNRSVILVGGFITLFRLLLRLPLILGLAAISSGLAFTVTGATGLPVYSFVLTVDLCLFR
jgi:hypothetical protein